MRHLATLATLTNAAAGALGIALALRGDTAAAPALLALALAMDGIDGRLARRFGPLPLGAVLDPLADAVSFVAFPAALLLVAGHPIAAGAFAAAGALRLALFAAARYPVSSASETFRGLPTSVAGALVVLAHAAALPLPALALLLAALMLAPLRYPMIRGAHARWLWPLVALTLAHGALYAAAPAWRAGVLRSAMAVVVAVLVVAPLLARRGGDARARAATPADNG